jgi:hypothetical protein
VADVMAASDVEADAIEIGGRVHRRVLQSRQSYITVCGEVEVERWLYKDRAAPTAHALAALDLRVRCSSQPDAGAPTVCSSSLAWSEVDTTSDHGALSSSP